MKWSDFKSYYKWESYQCNRQLDAIAKWDRENISEADRELYRKIRNVAMSDNPYGIHIVNGWIKEAQSKI